MTGNGEILLSGHKVEREAVLIVIRRNKWGQLGENLGGVKFPWSWYAAGRLMTSHSRSGRRGQMDLLKNTVRRQDGSKKQEHYL